MIYCTNQKVKFRIGGIDLYSGTNQGTVRWWHCKQSHPEQVPELTGCSNCLWFGNLNSCHRGDVCKLGTSRKKSGKVSGCKGPAPNPPPLEASSVTLKEHNKAQTNKLLLLLREGTHFFFLPVFLKQSDRAITMLGFS